MSQNSHFANGKLAFSPETRIRFLRLRNIHKWSLREREPSRLDDWEETFFRSRNFGKIGHFANGKAAVSPEARMRFLRLRNVLKWSHDEREPGCFDDGEETLFRCRNVGKNCHFANVKPAVSPEARIRFLRLRNLQKWSLRERESGSFDVGEKTFFTSDVSEKLVISRTLSRPFRRGRV